MNATSHSPLNADNLSEFNWRTSPQSLPKPQSSDSDRLGNSHGPHSQESVDLEEWSSRAGSYASSEVITDDKAGQDDFGEERRDSTGVPNEPSEVAQGASVSSDFTFSDNPNEDSSSQRGYRTCEERGPSNPPPRVEIPEGPLKVVTEPDGTKTRYLWHHGGQQSRQTGLGGKQPCSWGEQCEVPAFDSELGSIIEQRVVAKETLPQFSARLDHSFRIAYNLMWQQVNPPLGLEMARELLRKLPQRILGVPHFSRIKLLVAAAVNARDAEEASSLVKLARKTLDVAQEWADALPQEHQLTAGMEELRIDVYLLDVFFQGNPVWMIGSGQVGSVIAHAPVNGAQCVVLQRLALGMPAPLWKLSSTMPECWIPTGADHFVGSLPRKLAIRPNQSSRNEDFVRADDEQMIGPAVHGRLSPSPSDGNPGASGSSAIVGDGMFLDEMANSAGPNGADVSPAGEPRQGLPKEFVRVALEWTPDPEAAGDA